MNGDITMSQFEGFNTQNKLRIPLSSYTANILLSDCASFHIRKTTLINKVIWNYHPYAECSISLRLKDYKEELSKYLGETGTQKHEAVIRKLVSERARVLIEHYTKPSHADDTWLIPLNKEVKRLLTANSDSSEEEYYGSRPGYYIRELIDEYARLPFFRREEIIFQDFIKELQTAIREHSQVTVITNEERAITLKPYLIENDPLSMYHYLVGCTVLSDTTDASKNALRTDQYPVLSLRISRLKNVQRGNYQSGVLTRQETEQITNALSAKGVQFLSSDESDIQILLSDNGIRKYHSQLHLRPSYISADDHVYSFRCTETQILYYFFSFGKDAKILSPASLAQRFEDSYREAYDLYTT